MIKEDSKNFRRSTNDEPRPERPMEVITPEIIK